MGPISGRRCGPAGAVLEPPAEPRAAGIVGGILTIVHVMDS